MPEFGTGGAEKVVFNLVCLLAKDEFNIGLLLFLKKGYLTEQLPANVQVESFSSGRLFNAIPVLWKILRSDADLIFCSGYHNPIMALLSYLSGTSKKLILRETSVVGQANRDWKKTFLKRLVPITYSPCRNIIFQSRYGKMDFEKYFGTELSRAEILRNPAFTSTVVESDSKSIFLVGTLNANKNQLLGLAAIKTSGLTESQVEVFGDGKERQTLESYVSDEMKNFKVQFHGYVKGMDTQWGKASVLLVTSKHESFPNVIIEAAMAGVPSVCLLCPGGIKELYDLYNWGALVVEPQDLPEALKRVSQMSLIERQKLKANAERIFGIEARSDYLNFFRSYND